MKPEEAIKILKVAQAECEWNAPLDYQEAFEMAISALEKQDVPDTNVGDLISRQAAIDALRVAYWDDNIQSAKDDPCIVDAMTDWAIRQVKALPPAQPESLVNESRPLVKDTISRQQVIGALRNYLVGKNVPCDGTLTCRLIENEVISKLPSAQPDLSEYSDKLWQKAYERGKAEAQAEIVRCKDCRFNTYSKKCLNPDSFFLVPADDFYCGYAERRTDEFD